jgi:hypothetical protein
MSTDNATLSDSTQPKAAATTDLSTIASSIAPEMSDAVATVDRAKEATDKSLVRTIVDMTGELDSNLGILSSDERAALSEPLARLIAAGISWHCIAHFEASRGAVYKQADRRDAEMCVGRNHLLDNALCGGRVHPSGAIPYSIESAS